MVSEVSILVLLETALILKIKPHIKFCLESFNPCFIGNCSHTHWGCSLRRPRFPVSILVLLETALILRQAGLSISRLTSFNPCFIGNCSHTRANLDLFEPEPCFNPCFIGNCSHTRPPFYAPLEMREFQSLFYWKLLSYRIRPAPKILLIMVSILVLLETALIPRENNWNH